MAKEVKPQETVKTQKILAVFKEEGAAFGLIEYDIPTSILEKHGKEVSRSNPDLFAIFLINANKKFRELFGI